MRPRRITAKQYLATHELAVQLKRLKITRAQLDSVTFKKDDGDEFRDWRVICIAGPKGKGLWPPHLFHEMRVWCTLRWLILDDPAESRDRRDAWDYIALHSSSVVFNAQAQADQNLRQGRRLQNEQRAARADREALNAFNTWRVQVRDAITTMTLAKQIRTFKLAKGLDANSRQYRRLKELAEKGRVSKRISAPSKIVCTDQASASGIGMYGRVH